MIGLLPCAGTAGRFNGLPKWMLPCPEGYLIDSHIGGMKNAGCSLVYVGTSRENSDLIHTHTNHALKYIPVRHETMTQTVIGLEADFIAQTDQTKDAEYLLHENILFGMPDTYFDFPSVYERLATRLNESNADVVLAVFKARPEQHRQGGMVSISHNKVVDIVDKPEATHLQYIWGAMAWRARFWSCLTPDMPHVGYGVKVAIEQGFDVQAVMCAGGFWDCGTFERYVEMLKANT